MTKSYLVAFDGSHWSKAALNKAIEWATLTKHSITVLFVAEPIASFAGLVGESVIDAPNRSVHELTNSIQEHYREAGQVILEQAKKCLMEAEIPYELRLEFGSPRLTICEVATSIQSELIFIGSRGLGTVKRLFLGSVSDYVIHHSPCSVFLLHSDELS